MIQRLSNRLTDLLPMCRRLLITEPYVMAFTMPFRVFNHREIMFHANLITQTPDSHTGTEEIFEFVLPVYGRGVPDDVIVYMSFVYVSGDNESVPAFQKAACQFISDSVCLLLCNLSGLEGLTNLVGDHIVVLRPAGEAEILTL